LEFVLAGSKEHRWKVSSSFWQAYLLDPIEQRNKKLNQDNAGGNGQRRHSIDVRPCSYTLKPDYRNSPRRAEEFIENRNSFAFYCSRPLIFPKKIINGRIDVQTKIYDIILQYNAMQNQSHPI
jgi:hypothetical protein